MRTVRRVRIDKERLVAGKRTSRRPGWIRRLGRRAERIVLRAVMAVAVIVAERQLLKAVAAGAGREPGRRYP